MTRALAKGLNGSLHRAINPGGRLTLVTGTPVMSSNQADKTSVYYAPYVGDIIPIYDDSVGFIGRIFSELTLALDSDSGHTGYHQSGKNFDLFVYYDAGTLRLCTGPAWTNDSTRSAAISRVNGILVNTSSITLKYDATSATISAAAFSATYVGTMRASANGQTTHAYAPTPTTGGAQEAKMYLWNAYNQMPWAAFVQDSTSSYTNTATQQQTRNDSGNKFSWVNGLAGSAVQGFVNHLATNAATGQTYVGCAYDAITLVQGYDYINTASETKFLQHWNFKIPAAGYHYMASVEQGSAGTTTFYCGANYSLQGFGVY